MNEPDHDPQLDALFALAREHRPDTSAMEYAFETRLMARLRETRSTSSVWAMVAWRLAPIFALCVITLTVWYSQIAVETSEAEQMAYMESPTTLDSASTLINL